VSVLEWVEGWDIEFSEIPFIPRRNNQPVHTRGCGDHGVLK
jgi:hypothetical protein